MRYKGKDMTLSEYYNERMSERTNTNDKYKSEVEWNILADYESSCGFGSISELDFLESLGYTVEDFRDPMLYEVVISAGAIRRVLLQTEIYREALELYDAYNNGSGDFVDENGFDWDLYIDEWER